MKNCYRVKVIRGCRAQRRNALQVDHLQFLPDLSFLILLISSTFHLTISQNTPDKASCAADYGSC